VFALALLAVTAFFFLALYSEHRAILRGDSANICGTLGSRVAGIAMRYLGIVSSYLAVGVLAVWSLSAFFRARIRAWGWKLLGAGLLVVSISTLEWHLTTEPLLAPDTLLRGGIYGEFFGKFLFEIAGPTGTTIVTGLLLLIGLLLATEVLISPLVAVFLRRSGTAVAGAGKQVPGVVGGIATGLGKLIPARKPAGKGKGESPPPKPTAKERARAAAAEAEEGATDEEVDTVDPEGEIVSPARPRSESKRAAAPVEPSDDGAEEDDEVEGEEEREREPSGSAKGTASASPAAQASSSPAGTGSRRARAAQTPSPLPAEAAGAETPRSVDSDDGPDPATENGAPPAPRPERVIRLGPESAPTAAVTFDERQLTFSGVYHFPPITFLEDPPKVDHAEGRDELDRVAQKIEDTLNSFKIEARVHNVQRGPVITQYEVSLAAGIKVHKIVSLSDDLAMALSARSVRVVAPIPGKSTAGIEVPNTRREVVGLKELLQSRTYLESQGEIPLCLGKDAAGDPMIEDLAKMPHLMIAGSTGSGKSVCINSIIASILMTQSPDDLKMILIDPKMVELSLFEEIPHLLTPVITDMKKAPAALDWLVRKMDQRYELLSKAGVRHLRDYNELGKKELYARLTQKMSHEEADEAPEHLPYIVVIVDEFADLMMSSAKEVENHITRLAQKSRAVGIHVILATQRPSVNVITGLIKANLPTRISFMVASKVDSRTVLDRNGAEKLLGQGDMLYIGPGTSEPKRAQSTYISDKELRKVVNFLKKDAQPQFSREIEGFLASGGGGEGGEDGEGPIDDELFGQAVEIVLESGRASTTLLQRRLQIGYTRASRLMDIMGDHGIVGPFRGSKPREILMSLEEWRKQTGAGSEG